MINEYLDLIISRLKEDKRLSRALIILFCVLLLGWLGYNYLSKGTLEVSVSGTDGSTRLIVSKIKDGSPEPKETIKNGRSAKIKLRPGSYKVVAEVEVGSGASAKVSSSFKEVSVKARATTSAQLKIEQAKVISTQDIKDKPAFMSLANGKLYVTTVYGVSNTHNLKDSTYATIRKEPAYLRDVIGLCNFSNGRSLAVDKNSAAYSVDGTQAQALNLSTIFQGEESYEFLPKGIIQGTKDFICKPDGALLFGSILVNQGMQPSAVAENSYRGLGSHYSPSSVDDSLWFFNLLDADSFEGEGGSSTPINNAKKVTKVSIDGSKQSITLDSYVSGVSPYSDTGFCFYYQKNIQCGDIASGKVGEPFKLPDNKLVTNIVAIDGKRVVYSFGTSAWIVNLETGLSTQIYTSDHEIVGGSMAIDRKLGILTFGAQKVSSTESSNKAPIIEYGQVGL